MNALHKLFFLLLNINHVFLFDKESSFNIKVDELSVGKLKNYTLNYTSIYMIEIRNLSNIIETVPPRIFVKCEDCNENNPLLVVVSQNKGILSWELPLLIEQNNYRFVYKNTERTLCPYDILNNSNSVLRYTKNVTENILPVTLSLSTSSNKNVEVQLVVYLEENFVMELDHNKSVQVTPSTPAFYLFKFGSENVTSVLLHVTSEDDICLIVSIQNVSCPVFDLEENVGFRGHYQTVTRQGGLTLTKEAFPNGFYVVLIVSSEDKYCSSMTLNKSLERTKNVVISFSKSISIEDYKQAVLVTLLLIITFCTAMFLIFFLSIRRRDNFIPALEDEIIIQDVTADVTASTFASRDSPKSVRSPVSSAAPDTLKDTISTKTDSSLDETDFDILNDAEVDKNVVRIKNILCLADLARKNQSILKKKSELYFWNLLIVGIFYFLPVFQLVFTDQFRFNEYGRIDLCYYNFLCAHPLWWFSDFNHMFSNTGYIFFGVLFVFLTVLKEKDYKKKICCNKVLYKNYGIPQHFGIFYAMGTALIIEGIMSLCYHICPNHYNFQFDTSFMYVICTLCMIKIYQTRHPDINANAYATFSLLAAVIALAVYGVFSNNFLFWILFTIMHLSVCIYLSLQIYYIGMFKLEFENFIRWSKENLSCHSCRLRHFVPMYKSRFALLVVANACNWGLAAVGFVYEFKNFSSYLLAIFMVNLVLYTAFYILMKFICKEKLTSQSIFYILLAMLCWSAALYFFFGRTISWRLTPAESKLYNQKCKLLNFYDNHDIWHFISAAAMFFSFMVLLTLDDDLIYVHRSKIVVF